MRSYKLINGVDVPSVGFGTYLLNEQELVLKSIENAINLGYRKIDTASYYKNECYIGKALKNCKNVKRDEIFVTSKVWNSQQGYDSTLKSFENSILNLEVEYLDSYLIHWPKPKMKETWRALERLYEEGLVKAIGVCNFTEEYLECINNNSNIMPMINQIECHPYLQQKQLRKYCKERNILIEAWGPLMQGRIFEMTEIKELAKKYNKSISQVVLKWHLQSEMTVIPKSTNEVRIASNFDIFGFNLSKEDMSYIENNLDKNIRVGPNPNDIYTRA